MLQSGVNISLSENCFKVTGKGVSVPLRDTLRIDSEVSISLTVVFKGSKNNNIPFLLLLQWGMPEPSTCNYITQKGLFKVTAKLLHFNSARRYFLHTDHFTEHSRDYVMKKKIFLFHPVKIICFSEWGGQFISWS